MITAEVAIYPLKTGNASGVINNAIDALDDTSLNYEVDSMKTHLSGENAEVFSGLESMFETAQREGGEISMVVTITNAG